VEPTSRQRRGRHHGRTQTRAGASQLTINAGTASAKPLGRATNRHAARGRLAVLHLQQVTRLHEKSEHNKKRRPNWAPRRFMLSKTYEIKAYKVTLNSNSFHSGPLTKTCELIDDQQ
jgi:hypothetical protein